MSKKIKQIPYTKYPDPIELTVVKLNDKGQGIAYLDKYEIYLEDAVDGDVVLAKVEAPFTNGSKRRPANVLSFIKKSDNRAQNNEDVLKHSTYAYGKLKYEISLEKKRHNILEALKKAQIKAYVSTVEPTDLSKPSRYKTIRYFALTDNKVINGFYKTNSHEVESVEFSSLEPKWFSDFANDLCRLFTDNAVSVYDEESRLGLLRYLLLRDTQKQRLCVLTVFEQIDENLVSLYKKLAENYQIEAIYLNINGSSGNQILNGNLQCLSEKEQIKLSLCDFEFNAGPNTFLQVNYDIASKLYQEAIDFCGKDKEGHALDLCCGVGTMTLCLSRNFESVKGIEIVEDSIKAACINAEENHVDNVSLEVGDVKNNLKAHLKDPKLKAIICDPSRAGIGHEACTALASVKGSMKLAYIFCSLTALTRDLKTLVENGYRIESVKGFDMFPFTSHVETLVLLSKN